MMNGEVNVISGAWPSGKATDFEEVAQEKMTVSSPAVATFLEWALAPDFLTVRQAERLTGHSRGYLLSVIEAGGVDLDTEGRIEKRSLGEWQETEALLAHWED